LVYVDTEVFKPRSYCIEIDRRYSMWLKIDPTFTVWNRFYPGSEKQLLISFGCHLGKYMLRQQ